MTELVYEDIGRHKPCSPNMWESHLTAILPPLSATYNAAMVQAFFPENYISKGVKTHYRVEVLMQSGDKAAGKWVTNASAEILMKGIGEVVAPPLVLVAKVDLLKAKKTDLRVSFFLHAPNEKEIKLYHGRGNNDKLEPWTAGSLTALLVSILKVNSVRLEVE